MLSQICGRRKQYKCQQGGTHRSIIAGRLTRTTQPAYGGHKPPGQVTPHRSLVALYTENHMDDAQLEIIKAEIRRLEQKVDAVQNTLQAQLEPLTRLYRGNGKPSLEARLFHVEQEVGDQIQNTRWAVRTALGAMLAALGTVLWSLIHA